MPLDAIGICALSQELHESLAGAKIEKIHQPERDELMIALRGGRRLTISANSANPRIHFTARPKENPAAPPMFCMLLRKHLAGGKILSVMQLEFERIIDMAVECYTELGDLTTKHLICEIMGRNSNIILTDQDMRIVDSIKHVDLTVSSLRNILPGLTYMLPPAPPRLDPRTVEQAALCDMLRHAPEGKSVDGAIVEGVAGISPLLARECVFRALGDANLRVGELSPAQCDAVAAELCALFARVMRGEFEPVLLLRDARASDFSAVLVTQYGSAVTPERQETMSDAIESYFYLRDRDASMKNHAQTIAKTLNLHLQRARKKLQILQNDLKAAGDRERLRIMGDLVMANLHRMKNGDRELVAENYYDESLASITIPLDVKRSPSQNAKQYYARYKKAKNTEIYATEQIALTRDEIAYLESVQLELENAATLRDLSEIRAELTQSGYLRAQTQKKSKQSTTRIEPMMFEYAGYTIYIGKNNVQNDYVTLRLGRSQDLWLHTKHIPGSHTLVKFQGEAFPNDVIETAAKLAAYFSKGRQSPRVEVDYCPISHVRKPNGAKAGMVIYEGYQTAAVEPDEALVKRLQKGGGDV